MVPVMSFGAAPAVDPAASRDSFDAGAVALVPQLGDAPVRASPDRNDPAGWRDLEALFEDFASAKNAKRTSMDMFDFLSAAPEMVPGGVDVDVDALVPTLSDGVVPSVPRASIDSTMPKATRTSLDSILGGNDDLLFGMVSGDKLRVPAFIDPNASQASQADLMVPEAVVPAPAPAESPVPAVRAVPSWDAAPQEEEEEEERDVDVEDADFAPHVPAPELVLCTVPFAERMRDPEARRQRLVAIERYRSKRQRRQFKKTIRYQSRKAYAEVRPRIKGRFATKEEVEQMKAEAIAEAQARGEPIPEWCLVKPGRGRGRGGYRRGAAPPTSSVSIARAAAAAAVSGHGTDAVLPSF